MIGKIGGGLKSAHLRVQLEVRNGCCSRHFAEPLGRAVRQQEPWRVFVSSPLQPFGYLVVAKTFD